MLYYARFILQTASLNVTYTREIAKNAT